MTGFLDSFIAWETSSAGKTDITTVFATHKAEILEMLNVLPPLFTAIGSLYVAVSPALVKAVTVSLTALVKGFTALVSIPDVGPVIGAVALLSWKLGLLAGPFKLLNSAISSLLLTMAGKIPGIGGLFKGSSDAQFNTSVDKFALAVDKFSAGGVGGGGAGKTTEQIAKDAGSAASGAVMGDLAVVASIASKAAIIATPAAVAVALSYVTRTTPATRTNVTATPVGGQYGSAAQAAAFELALRQAATTGYAAGAQAGMLTPTEKAIVTQVQDSSNWGPWVGRPPKTSPLASLPACWRTKAIR